MYLLDTDIIIYNLKGNEMVRQNLRNHINDPIQISSVTLMELYYGAFKSRKVESNIAKVRKIENSIEIISIDTDQVELFGMLKVKLEKAGTPLDDFDLILAATALSHNLILVTNNERHFSRIEGLQIDNWAKKAMSNKEQQ